MQLRLFSPVILIVASAISVAQNTQAFHDHPLLPVSFVDIGNRRLHLNCTGRGSPTVSLGFSMKLEAESKRR